MEIFLIILCLLISGVVEIIQGGRESTRRIRENLRLYQIRDSRRR